jgi:hypothetical protein
MSAASAELPPEPPWMALQRSRAHQIALATVIIYITLYAFESPVRYALSLAHLDSAILVRDLLILGPLTLIACQQWLERRLQPVFWIFAIFLTIGSVISYSNFGELRLAAVGSKMMLNVLLGMVTMGFVVLPGPKLSRYLMALWILTLTGLVLEKFFVKFPWVGVKAVVAGVQVEISRDWQMAQSSQQRVGGFTKESISAACLLGQLAPVVAWRLRSYLLRIAVLIATLVGIYLTTQKGAIIALFLVMAAMAAPQKIRLPMLRLLTVFSVLMVVGLPVFTNGLTLEQGHGGVFSVTSFAERIDDTWPKGFDWIHRYEVFPFGIGVGGIGASLIVLAIQAEHLPDNMFILLYAFFGVPCFLFFGSIVYGVIRSVRLPPEIAGPALSVLSFNLLYGTVVTLVEDQVGAFFLGSALGVLVYAAPMVQRRIAGFPASKSVVV